MSGAIWRGGYVIVQAVEPHRRRLMRVCARVEIDLTGDGSPRYVGGCYAAARTERAIVGAG